MKELKNLTISEIHNSLIKKEFSAIELTKALFDEIEEKDKKILAFLTLTETMAFSQAKRIDDLILQKKEIPFLAGIPMSVKDNILVKDIKCTAASKILENYIAPYDATVVKKLKENGAIILGKTNLDEFAMGSSTENSGFFTTRNPYDLTRVAGGSSGGSAASVAAGISIYSLGSDTGGSIRLPASFCGVVGLKPTYGSVSRFGLIAFASSLDQIGPLTKNVKDAEIVFEAIKGRDEMDSTSIRIPKPSLFKFEIKNTKIGLVKEYFEKGLDSEAEKVIKKAIKKYEDLGAKIENISLPHTEYALATYYIIAPAEASANLARYDAIRYSQVKGEEIKPKDLLDYYLKKRAAGFGDEVKRRIMLGTYTLSAGYYDAYYLRAQKVRTKIKNDFEKAFKKVDLILAPVSPSVAFKIGEKIKDPLSMYLTDTYNVSTNLAGLPALTIPCGKAHNLPTSFQIIAKPFEENKLFELGKIFEES